MSNQSKQSASLPVSPPMSTGESGDNVEKVRQRIIQLAREIEEHSRSNMPPEQFFSEFLKRVVGAVGARAGAVWMRNGSKKIGLFTDLNLKQTGFFDKADAAALNQKLLDEVLSNGQACSHSPNDGSDVQVPTNDLIVLASLQQSKQCVGVVEVFQRVDTPAAARPGFLQFIEQMCGYACRYLDRQAAPKPTIEARTKITEEFEQFLLQLHRGLDVAEIAATAANDGRMLLGCDRLSVAVQYGKKTVIKAISGQDSVHQRANLVKRMASMANKVILMREPLTYTGKLDHLPPQITTPLADYIQESGSRMVIVWPLFESEPLVQPEDKAVKKKDKPKKPIGGLIVEQISESQPRPGTQEKIESLADHVSEALFNGLTYRRLFLLPLWKFLGSSFRFMEGRGKLKVLACVLSAAALIAAMCLVPWDYRVEGDGRLMPVVQKDVFAPWDGRVVEIFVKGGDKVEAGTPLLRIFSDELHAQWLAETSKVEVKGQELASLQTEFEFARQQGNKIEEIRLEGKMKSTHVEWKGAQILSKTLKERLDNLTVVAPQPGTIATFEVERQLKFRPVRRGELLLEIKDETGPWWLQLEVAEHRMGHLLRAVRANEEDKSGPLAVEYVLATNPEDRFQGTLKPENVETRSNASNAKDAAIVRVRVDINKEDLINQADRTNRCRIGAEVRAKITCGPRSLGYVLFGDVVEFVQKYLWL